MQQFIIEKDQSYIFKPFSVNGDLGIDIRFHSILRDKFSSIACLDDVCEVCKIQSNLQNKGAISILHDRAKLAGIKMNLKRFDQFVIPMALWNITEKFFSYGVSRFWMNQALPIARFIGDPDNEENLKFGDMNSPDLLLYSFSKANSFNIEKVDSNNLMFFITNNEKYSEFVGSLENFNESIYESLGIYTDYSYLKTVYFELKQTIRSILSK